MGGGVCIEYGRLDIENVVIEGNIANNGGGIFTMAYVAVNIKGNCYIVDNTASTNGGGINAWINTNVSVDGSIKPNYITDNNATNGGGIYMPSDNSVNIIGTNYITTNSASGDGGGIYTESIEYSNLDISGDTAFNRNRASAAYIPPEDATVLYPNLGFSSTSITNHPLNNYDINYIGDVTITFNINYNSNGGSGSYIGPDVQPGGIDIILSPEDAGISQDKYTFIAWNTEADGSGTSYSPEDNITLNGNITLYAQWRANENIVTFESNGGTPVDEQRVPFDLRIPKPEDPTKQGYIFDGWYTDNGTFLNEWDFNTPVINNLTLYAKWLEDSEEYTVRFNSNGGTPVDSQIVQSGQTAVKPVNPTKTGYIFEGWYTDDGTFKNEWNFDTPINEEIILYAKWKKDNNCILWIWILILMFTILAVVMMFCKKVQQIIRYMICKIKKWMRCLKCKCKCKNKCKK